MTQVVIAGAARTAVGSLNGSLSTKAAHELGEVVIRGALGRAQVDASEVDEVILGQVLVGGGGQNPVRQAALAAGLPDSSTAFGISQVCGSGLRSVMLGAQSIMSGDAGILVVGGQESMSLAPHVVNMRTGVKMGTATLTDSMIRDGLEDAFNNYHMGVTAENVAGRWQVSREDQDQFALLSQQKAAKAQADGRFAEEIVPVTVKQRKAEIVVDKDEHLRPDTTIEALAKLRPAFDPKGTVTAGNASGINDGAAAMVLMTGERAEKRGIEPLARIVASAVAGVDPSVMGIGPVPAVRKVLAKAGWGIDDVDLIELNEAFAAQGIAVSRELGLDPDRVNVNGGAIALGHPIGASGARILVTLVHAMKQRDAKRGLATLCVGGGMGVALLVERD